MNGLDTLIVAGSGQSNLALPDMFEARTRTTIRYADPSAWITANAVACALSDFGDRLTTSQQEVGMIVVSDRGPWAAMGETQAAASAGFSSPLRYAASNPGSLVAVACIAFGFRGPTLNLAMRPEDGVPVALELSAGWLTRRSAQWMVLATYTADSVETGLGRAVLLAPATCAKNPGKFSISSASQWLMRPGNTEKIHEEPSYTQAR